MNPRTLMLTPWRARQPAWSWLALAIAVLAVGSAIAVALFAHKPDWWVASTFCLGAGAALLWAFVFPRVLLLAIDARQLRLPSMARYVAASLAGYGLVSVLLPAAVFGLCGAKATVVACLLALWCLGGLLFQLLPRFLAVFIGFLPMALQTLPVSISLPGPLAPGFVHWAAPAIPAMLLVAGWRWYRLWHDERPYEASWNKPLLLQFRCVGGWNTWTGFAGGTPDMTRQLRNTPDWLRPQVDLCGTGPGRIGPSLRIALGSLFMPLTMAGRLKQWSLLVLPSLLFVVLMALQKDHHPHPVQVGSLWGRGTLFAMIWFGAFGSSILAAIAIITVQQRWRKANAELPLLALLPALGSGSDLRRDLLRAVMLPPLCVQAALIAVLIFLDLAGAHLGVLATLLLLLSQFGSAGFLLASTLAIIGGRPLPDWQLGLLAILGYVTICISTLLPVLDGNGSQLHIGQAGCAMLAVMWATLIVALLWLGRRGWLGLQRRPHPFLPN
jgi:hypothetical protein